MVSAGGDEGCDSEAETQVWFPLTPGPHWHWGDEVTPARGALLPLQSRLHQNCSALEPINYTINASDDSWCSWAPFGKSGVRAPFPLLQGGVV